MKTVKAILERANDGGWGAYCADEMFTGMGDTIEQAKENLLASIAFHLESCKQGGYDYPSWIEEPFDVLFQFDVQSLLEYYTGIITPTALSRMTGIHPKQLWSYAHGKTKPRAAQIQKIENGLHRLSSELASISLM